MKYDIRKTFFRLPTLTVESLVENAIRHGVPMGGTVTLSTRSDQNGILITVSDDGVRFDQSGTQKEKERTGIGIRNVQTGPATLCGGTLGIVNTQKGTLVTIRLPNCHT